MTLPATLRALRYRNFQLFFSGQSISLIGTWMQNVAQAWLVYRLTGSAVLLGSVSFAGQIPVFLMSPLGGTIGRQLDRPLFPDERNVVLPSLAHTANEGVRSTEHSFASSPSMTSLTTP